MTRSKQIVDQPIAEVDLWYPPPEGDRPGLAFWMVMVAAILAILAAILMLGAGLLWYSADLILPGVQINDIDLGGRQTEEATYLLDEAWRQPTIELSWGSGSELVAPESLGYALDADSAVRRAYQAGRSLESLELWIRGRGQLAYQPEWSFDAQQAAAYLETIKPRVDRAAVDGKIIIENGQAIAVPPQMGQALDLEASLASLTQDPGQFLGAKRLDLSVQPISPVVGDLSALIPQVNQRLEQSVIVRAFDPITGEKLDLTIAPQVWSSWLTVELGANNEPVWSFDTQQLQSYLAQQINLVDTNRYFDSEQLTAATSNALNQAELSLAVRLYHRDRQHVVQAGETLTSIGYQYGVPYPWIQQANPGLSAGLYPGQEIVIPSADAFLPLPVIPDKRIVVSIPEQRVRVYEAGQLIWDWPASTGISDSPTWPGIYQVQSHEPNAYAGNWDLWMPSFMGVYQPVPGSSFMNGFHGFPTRNGQTLLWTNDLGRPVTYGCILLSSDNATTLYGWAEEGVVVEIQS